MATNIQKIPHSEESEMFSKTIAKIFLRVHSKIRLNDCLINNTNTYLSIDILGANSKKILLQKILLEIEQVILMLIASESDFEIFLESRLDFITKLIFNIIQKLTANCKKENVSFYSSFYKNDSIVSYTIKECCFILNMALYLIRDHFVSVSLSKTNTFMFSYNQLCDLLEALLDTLVIRVSHCISYLILNSGVSTNVNRSYSKRELISFRNNLSKEFYIEKYLYKPKAEHENKYRLWVITPKGILYRYIKTFSFAEKESSNRIFKILLEIIDFFIPIFLNVIFFLRWILNLLFSQFYFERLF